MYGKRSRFGIYDMEDLSAALDEFVEILCTLESADERAEFSNELFSALEDFVQREREDYHGAGFDDGRVDGFDEGYAEGKNDAISEFDELAHDVEKTLPVAVDYLNGRYLPPTYTERRVADDLRMLHLETMALRTRLDA